MGGWVSYGSGAQVEGRRRAAGKDDRWMDSSPVPIARCLVRLSMVQATCQLMFVQWNVLLNCRNQKQQQ